MEVKFRELNFIISIIGVKAMEITVFKKNSFYNMIKEYNDIDYNK